MRRRGGRRILSLFLIVFGWDWMGLDRFGCYKSYDMSMHLMMGTYK